MRRGVLLQASNKSIFIVEMTSELTVNENTEQVLLQAEQLEPD